MFYIKGKQTSLKHNRLIIECNNIGYWGYIVKDIESDKKEYDKVFVFEYKNEFSTELFFFEEEKHLHMFSALINIKNIGIKTCLQIFETYSFGEFEDIIKTGDDKRIMDIKSVGAWTSKIIITEMKSKLFNMKYNTKQIKVFDSLQKLGYKSKVIYNILDQIDPKLNEEQILSSVIERVSLVE